MSTPELSPEDRPRRQYRFGDFILDLEGGFLRRGGEEIPLRPKAFEVLTYLVKHHGTLVTKDALIEAVWSATAVTDNSLARCLLEIRRALADDSQQMIRTVARRGYVFTSPVSTALVEFPLPTAAGPAVPGPSPVQQRPVGGRSAKHHLFWATLILLATAAAGLFRVWLTRPAKQEVMYTQITSFTDSAVSPASSPDGRMVAFFRSEEWFLTPDQIYVKFLPDGEPVQLTNDPRPKCCLAFSPDGSRIAYTALESGPSGWKTYMISPLAGEPALLLSNAAGLTWLDQRRLLFSEIRTGVHMGIVTATETRSDYRPIYFPRHERAMAHFSYASPDRKWILVAEMDPVRLRCRVVPLDGSSAGWQVGPEGKCTSAAWSPDGKSMYFGAEVDGSSHLWRQRFPQGKLEQITSGPVEASGVAVAPDGRSVITSIGTRQSVIWLHDASGERPLRTEGYVAPMRGVSPHSSARFSSDGQSVYYLMRRDSPASSTELWRTHLGSGKSEAVLSGVSIEDYDLSSDGMEVVFSTTNPSKKVSELWLAPLDRSSVPKMIALIHGRWPHFGPDGQLLFQWNDGKANYLARLRKDGSQQTKVVPFPVGNIYSISPDRRWTTVGLPLPDRSTGAVVAIPTGGGDPRRICAGFCPAAWAPDGKFLYVGVEPGSRTSPGKTAVIPLPPGEPLPELPPSGIRGLEDARALPGTRVVDGYRISPGPDPSVFVYMKTTMHRNLFRLRLPD